jgi:hypothetical protein
MAGGFHGPWGGRYEHKGEANCLALLATRRVGVDYQALAPGPALTTAGGRSDTGRIHVADVVGRENCEVCESR